MSEVLDYMFRHDLATLNELKASGAHGVARYLDPYNPKGITQQEVADIHEAGLDLHLFFETTGGSGDPGYFTRAQGEADCIAAQNVLRNIGAPDGIVVYFAIDTNIEPSSVTEYANGIEAVQTPSITPGLYGYQRLCEYAHEHFPNLGKHLFQTYGTPTVPLDGWQHLQEDRAGVSVDVSDVSVPGWSKPKELEVAFKDDPDAIAFREDIKTTLDAIKDRLGLDAHHTHIYNAPAGGRTSEPLEPPVPGAAYFSASDDLTMVGWSYPDGKVRFFRNGVAVST